MIRSRMMVLGAALVTLASARRADAQGVFVDVGVNAPSVGARIVWGAPPPVVVYQQAPAYYYPPPVRVVYYQSLPYAYWDYVRVYEPYRYARMRAWLDYERSYDRAWRMHDRERYEELRESEGRYYGERADIDRDFRSWKVAQSDDGGRGWGRGRGWDRGRGHGRGHDRDD